MSMNTNQEIIAGIIYNTLSKARPCSPLLAQATRETSASGIKVLRFQPEFYEENFPGKVPAEIDRGSQLEVFTQRATEEIGAARREFAASPARLMMSPKDTGYLQ